MPRREKFDFESAQLLDGSFHSLGRDASQVHSAEHRPKRLAPGEFSHVAKRVDHSGVGAAEQQDHTPVGLQEERLVIDQRVPGAVGLDQEQR
jgi:hypothetical protein